MGDAEATARKDTIVAMAVGNCMFADWCWSTGMGGESELIVKVVRRSDCESLVVELPNGFLVLFI